MSNNLGRTEVSVNQTDKETAINNSDARLDAAISDSITYTWSGSQTLKTASTAETQQHVSFVFAGSTSGTPSFKFGNVQRGVVVVKNDLVVSIDITDYSTATTITVPSGRAMAIYVTASGLKALYASDAVLPNNTTDVLTGTNNTLYATADSIAALWEDGGSVASAGTISLGEGGYFNITGTTTITDIDFGTDKAGRRAILKFAGALTLTHNASTLILPTGANITTAAGDMCEIVSEGADAVRVVSYTRASGAALVGSTSLASTTEVLTGTDSAKATTPDAVAALWEQGSDIASAGTISIGEGGHFHVTGTTGITDIDWGTDKAGRKVSLTFDGILTLTHSSTLILPTGANITTAAGDTAIVVSEGADVARVISYNRANGTALSSSGFSAASTTDVLTGTDTTKGVTADALAALWEDGGSVASAGTISLGEGGYFNITGTTTITDIDFATDKAGRQAILKFAGALTLTHSSTLICPGGQNITTVAGDTCEIVSEGSDIVRIVRYTRGNGQPYVIGGFFNSAPTASEVILRHVAPVAVLIVGNMSGSVGDVRTNPASSFVMDVAKNGSNVGTITVSTGGAFTFATTSGNPISLAIGDRLTVTAPASPDASVAGLSFSILGLR